MEVFREAALTEAATLVARGLKRPSLPAVVLSLLAFVLDALAIALAIWFAEFAAAGLVLQPGPAALAATGVALTAVGGLAALGGYRPALLRRFWGGWGTLALAAGVVGTAALQLELLSGWATVMAPMLLALPGRAFAAAAADWTLASGLIERRAVVVGGGGEAERLIRGLATHAGGDIRICGLFDDRDDERSPQLVITVPKLGTIRELLAFCRLAEIDMLIIALPLTAERRIREILDLVRVLPIDVRISTYSSDLAFPRRSVSDGLLDVFRRPLAGWRWLAKRAMDIGVASVALVVLSPVFVAAALAIRCETTGPVFFRQTRHGYNNRPIRVWKFRSMYADQCDSTARRIVTRHDARVTRVGAFLRRWSIDELPQLLNVLRGDLSVVGPRPHAVEAVSSRQKAFEEIVEGYAARHRVPPGVTGWAQIHGWRGEVDDPAKLEARVAHDLYYIENWSFWLDLYILARTPLSLFDKRGAY